MDEAVEDGVSYGGVLDDTVPMVDGELAGDEADVHHPCPGSG